MGDNPSRLRAENLTKRFNKRTVVRGVTLEARQGEVVGLLGPNGAGKTTSFYMIAGMFPPNSGKVYFDDKDITAEPMYRRARMGVVYLPQEPSIFRKLSVEDNIKAILQIKGLSKARQKERLEELLEKFDIARIRKSKGYSLSGGERRRCEIARALASEPKFIMLDEPFAGIDPIAVEDIMEMVKGLKKQGIGTLITDHNARETLSITDRAYILIDGKIFISGSSDEVARNEEVRKRYLGDNFRL